MNMNQFFSDRYMEKRRLIRLSILRIRSETVLKSYAKLYAYGLLTRLRNRRGIRIADKSRADLFKEPNVRRWIFFCDGKVGTTRTAPPLTGFQVRVRRTGDDDLWIAEIETATGEFRPITEQVAGSLREAMKTAVAACDRSTVYYVFAEFANG